MASLTAERLRELVIYDPEKGVFTRRCAIKGYSAGSECGAVNKNGYVSMVVDGYKSYAHRLAFLYMTGSLPPADVDHVNGVRNDNRWSNLRLATRSQNMWNVKRCTGAYQQNGRWYASIKVDGKRRSLGGYSTKEDASAAYHAAVAELRNGITQRGCHA